MIDEIELLHELYGTIVIPNAVVNELTHPLTPPKVREWMGVLPQWAAVGMAATANVESGFIGLANVKRLGYGELEAITLARKVRPSILLTDDRKARNVAENLGIQTVPTIRVLSTAAELGLVGFGDAIRRLQQTNFRVSRKFIEDLLRKAPLE